MPLTLGRWMQFLEIGDETKAALEDVYAVAAPQIDSILDVFYTRIARDGVGQKLMTPEAMEHARAAQRKHWLTYVLRGRFNEEYLAAARAIGQIHHQVGVDLVLYTGSYSVVLSEFVGQMVAAYHDDPDRLRRALTALNQVVFLDMGLGVAVYHDAFVSALAEMSNEVNFSLARAGEFRDNETGMHLMRMSRMCSALARALGRDGRWVEMLEVASPLHDVGKIGIPDSVLLKPGRLDDAELEVMRRHPQIGGQIIPEDSAEVIRMAKRIALTHHERWDGAGYPAGLKGEEIPLEGRIAAICDVYDALLSDRPYKEPWTRDAALAYLRDNRGRHFDPDLVARFLKMAPEMDAIRGRYRDTQPSEVAIATPIAFDRNG